MERSERVRASEEVAEQRGVGDSEQLIEEGYGELVERGSVDPVDEVLQVLVVAFEVKLGERRKDETPWWGQRRVSVSSIVYGSRESEVEEELLERGQRRQASGHRIG
jgi:hypothetical protein